MPIIDVKPFYQDLLKPKQDAGLELFLSALHCPPLTNHRGLVVNFYNTNAKAQLRRQTHYKSYPYKAQVPLSSSLKANIQDLHLLLEKRRAHRQFIDKAMSFEQLSALLKNGYGLVSEKPTKRTAPSGGARHSTEIYPIVLNVEGLKNGLYHYNVKSACLELLKEGNFKEELRTVYGADKNTLHNVSVVLAITAVFHRTIEKYGPRGWKLLMMDTGHIGQNFWLLATSMKLGFCPLAGGREHDLSRFMSINKYFELPLIAYCLGVIEHE